MGCGCIHPELPGRVDVEFGFTLVLIGTRSRSNRIPIGTDLSQDLLFEDCCDAPRSRQGAPEPHRGRAGTGSSSRRASGLPVRGRTLGRTLGFRHSESVAFLLSPARHVTAKTTSGHCQAPPGGENRPHGSQSHGLLSHIHLLSAYCVPMPGLRRGSRGFLLFIQVSVHMSPPQKDPVLDTLHSMT